jgi:multiple sugar transport system permease protein
VLYLPVSVILALLAALAVHARRRRWSRHVLGAVFLLPYATSSVAIAILWQMILQSGSLAMGRIDWLSEPGTAVPALMVISLWAHVGGQMIVLLAGLERIPQPLLDAARVDGAGPWRCFWRVTFPLLRPVAALVTVTGVMGALQMFTLAFVLTPQNVIVSRAYRIAWGAQLFGLASALSVALLVVLLILRWPQQGLLRRRESHG